VLATFTHAQRGTDELRRLLRGLISGFGAFALFCFVLALALRRLDTAAAFGLATGLALLTQALVLALVHEHPTPATPVQVVQEG
jgi:multidrug transporter EmrE-like cation transporter